MIKDENLLPFSDESELKLSQRLGISYNEIKNKFLISYDISDLSKKKILFENAKINFKIKNLDDDYYQLDFSHNQEKHKYFFHNDKLISPINYYTKDWQSFSGKYIKVFFSNPNSTNQEIVNILDNFIASILQEFHFNKEKIQKLEKEKIYYYLCDSPEEIEKLTTFNTRGIYILAYDYIVTTYKCHFHEIIHLLANYKIEKNNLYVNPFLMEGLAVSKGGRGGRTKNIIFDMGFFLNESGFASPKEFLARDNFFNANASFSYPLAGLYNEFLFKELGDEKYFQLYKKHSSTKYNSPLLDLSLKDLPQTKWKDFLKKYANIQENIFEEVEEDFQEISSADSLKIYESENYFKISAKPGKYFLGIKFKEKLKSNLSKEIFGIDFPQKRYGLIVSSSEIKTYDFLTDELFLAYFSSFSLTPQIIKKDKSGFFSFYIPIKYIPFLDN